MVDCPGRSELEAFLTDGLAGNAEAAVLRHVETCAVCQQLLEALTAGRTGAGSSGALAHTVPAADRTIAYPLPSRIGPYTLLRELGRGGMGVVYLAEQASLKRAVALKIIRHGIHATAGEVARLCAEAEAVARLQHPNIVQVYEVGHHEGVYFLALEYVAGASLDRVLAGTPQEPRAAAQLIETLARAVHHAHQRGILHRDLKPANILLQMDEDGRMKDESQQLSASSFIFHPSSFLPKITDFGLAKRLDNGDGAPTHSGLALGTPSYMAPEQAAGRHGPITAAVDVYGLGALLYEMLTGRPPFKGATALSTLEQVASQEPLAPSRFHRHVPRDLETICLKCLEKQPGQRYASAAGLADDVQRFLAGRPIVARPTRLAGRLWKWTRRQPLVVALAFSLLLVGIVGLAGILWTLRAAVLERDQARRQWYRANMAAAGSALEVHNVAAARASLADAPPEFRHCWEWRYFHSQLDNAARVLAEHDGPILGVAFSADGSRVASTAQDGTMRLWEAATGRLIAVGRGHERSIQAVAFSPDDRLLATGSDDGTMRVWNAKTGTALAVCSGHAAAVRAVAFSPDGKHLVSAPLGNDEQCRLWNAETGALVAELPARATTNGLACTPDGQRLICCWGHEVRIPDMASHREVMSRQVPAGVAFCCAVSRDGRGLATGWDYPDNAVRVWDLQSGELLAELRGHTNRIGSVAFSPDGTRVVSASQDQTVRVWAIAGPQLGTTLAVLRGHTSHVTRALFTPDGTRIISASFDGTLRLWNSSDGDLRAVFQGHEKPVIACALSRDGTWLASAGADQTVRLWDVANVERSGVLRGHRNYVYDVAFSPDGTHVASAAWDNSVRLWNVTQGRQTALFRGPGRRDLIARHVDSAPPPEDDVAAYLLAVAFSPDGAHLVSGGRDGTVQFWDVEKRALRRSVQLPGSGVDGLAFHPDGTRVAAAIGNAVRELQREGKVLILDAETGKVGQTLAGHTDGVLAVRYRPDGREIVSAGFDQTVRVWDAGSGVERAVLRGHEDTVTGLAFSTDGKLLASASRDGTVRLWDADTHQFLGTLRHASVVYAVAFSPDGARLAAACEDNTIRLWDVASAYEVAELRGHKAYVHALAFSPDGTRLVSASGDFTVRMWDTLAPQARAAGPPQR